MPNISPNITSESWFVVILYCRRPTQVGPLHLAFATFPVRPPHVNTSPHGSMLIPKSQDTISQYLWIRSPFVPLQQTYSVLFYDTLAT